MNTLLDPIHIAFFGGKSVGKTALLKRLAQHSSYLADDHSSRIYKATCQLDCQRHLKVVLNLYDFGSDYLFSEHPSSKQSSFLKDKPRSHLQIIGPALHCAFFVFDLTCKESIHQCTQWMETFRHCRRESNAPVVMYLIANKADLPLKSRVVSEAGLEAWKRSLRCIDWVYTVGHSALGDIDSRRGSMLKQECIEDVLQQAVQLAMRERDSKYYHIWKSPRPQSLHRISWKTIEDEETSDANAILS